MPDSVDPEAALAASIGPAIARLRQTFDSTAAYLDFWQTHPALAGALERRTSRRTRGTT